MRRRSLRKPLFVVFFLLVLTGFVTYNNMIQKISSIGRKVGGNLVSVFVQAPSNDTEICASVASNPYAVYYVWCKKESFTFVNYLSVMSVVQYLTPSKIVLFYSDYPVVDNQLYHIWLDDVIQKYPFFETVKISEDVCKLAGNKSDGRFARDYLQSFPSLQWNDRKVITRSLESVNRNLCEYNSSRLTRDKELLSQCSVINSTNVTSSELDICVELNFSLNPKDIWTLDNVFGRRIRKLFYDREEIPVLEPSDDELIPNIGHMIWFGGGTMDFLFYLGALSLLHVAEVDILYIHGEAPEGTYWEILKNETRVRFISYAKMRTVYGIQVKSVVHMSDILRVEVLKNYGGIYLDCDAVVVKPFGKLLRSYEAVASINSFPFRYRPFPDLIGNGLLLGKKNARFWRMFLESMKNFRDGDFTYNCCRHPYHLVERHPDLVHLDSHLQVLCFRLKCRATYWPNYDDPLVDHTKIPVNWRKDTYAMHWTNPTPDELKDHNILLKSSGMFADIGKYILEKSNMTAFFTHHG